MDPRLWAYRERHTEAISTPGVPHKMDVSLPAAPARATSSPACPTRLRRTTRSSSATWRWATCTSTSSAPRPTTTPSTRRCSARRRARRQHRGGARHRRGQGAVAAPDAQPGRDRRHAPDQEGIRPGWGAQPRRAPALSRPSLVAAWAAVSRSTGRDRSTIQVIAHRGSSDDAPEHTLSAYKRAIDDGADALECDVRLTTDGHLVCVHDRRIDRTSNGRGVAVDAGARGALRAGLGLLAGHLGGLRGPGGAGPGPVAEILTLRRLLEAVAEPDRRVEVAIETKHPTRYAGLVERRLVDAAATSSAGPRLGRLAGAGDELLAAVPAADAACWRPACGPSCSSSGCRCGSGTAACPGRGGAGPSIEIVRAHPRYVERVHRQGTRCTCGRSTRRRGRRAVPASWGWRRSSPTGRAGCCGRSAASRRAGPI